MNTAAKPSLLQDLPLEALKAVHRVLDEKYKPVVVNDPRALAGESERLAIAFEAGRRDVVDMLNAAIQQKERR